MTAMLDGPTLAPASGGPARSLVVLLHGYGSNGADLIGLAPLWRQALPDTAFIAPNAPEQCPGMAGAYQWWALSSFDRPALAAGARRAAPLVDRFLDDQLSRHALAADRLLLVGFSQGTMLSLHVGPRRTAPLAGILGYSGMLADPVLPPGEVRSRSPVLLIHGAVDQVVPVGGSSEAAAVLRAQGFAVETHVSPGIGHSVDPVGLSLGERFAARVLAA